MGIDGKPTKMKKLTYWVAPIKRDHACYNLRAKTRRQLKDQLASPAFDEADYGKPRKMVVEFQDAFDLLEQALSEGGIYEGSAE